MNEIDHADDHDSEIIGKQEINVNVTPDIDVNNGRNRASTQWLIWKLIIKVAGIVVGLKLFLEYLSR